MRFWDLLLDALMWPGSIEVLHIGMEDTVQLLLLQDEQVIEALSPHASQKAFTDGIGARSVIRYGEHLDVTRVREPCEAHPKLAIMITNEVLRPLAKGGSLPKLLCGPRVGRRACDADVDHFARVQVDDEEGEQRAEEEIRDGEEVAGPDLLGMRV